MYSRLLTIENKKSFFLLGPRATGKSTWTKQSLSPVKIIDLLDPATYNQLLSEPSALVRFIPKSFKGWVIIDEIQRVPELLNVVHQLIENQRTRFALTGSSARKLRRSGVNLLAGRALTYFMFPLTALELGDVFHLETALKYGMLPSVFSEPNPAKYLSSYVQTYLREEIQQEGLTRNLAAFSRFLQAASFSQASVLNISDVARDSEVERKVVESYFTILEDLLLGVRLPVFTKRAKRKTIAHPKFFFFDAGVYRAIRPAGPLDDMDVIPGVSLETLVWQEIRAINHYHELGFELFYWRTTAGLEVDIVLYGKRGLYAFEVKSSRKFDRVDLRSLMELRHDYSMAKCFLLYAGDHEMEVEGIRVIPLVKFFANFPALLDL